MKRLASTLACAGLAFGLGTAALAMPPVVDRVPDNAVFTIVVSSPDQVHKHATELLTAVEAPMADIPEPKSMLQMGGFPADAVDTAKSLAIVFFGPADMDKADLNTTDWEAASERSVVLLPVTNYANLLKAFDPDAKPDAAVSEIPMPSGDAGFIKDAGNGYAVLGQQKDLVEGFTGRPGDAPLKARMGKAGEALADSSDVVLIINMDRLRPLAQQGLKEGQEHARAEMAEIPGAGDLQKNLEMIQWLGETIVRDTQVIVGGVKVGAAGVNLDMVGAFKPDSYLAKAFTGAGGAGTLLGRLPGGPFYLAAAMDYSAPGVKQVWRDFLSKIDMPGGEAAKATALKNVDLADGSAALVGFPNGGVTAGILTNTVTYTASKNPEAAVQGFRDALLASNGVVTEGMKMSAKYTEKGATAGEKPVDTWEMRVSPAEPGQEAAAPQMQQVMAFLFGPVAAPAGYLARTDHGFYTTYAKNSELVTRALAAGNGQNIAADAQVKQAQSMLPPARMAELYIGTKSILDTVTPFMALAGMQVPVDKIPEALPPVGAAITGQDGAARFSIVVPAVVLKTGYSLSKAMDEAQDQGEAPAGEPDQKSGTGQPKF